MSNVEMELGRSHQLSEIKVYKYRYLIVFIYGLYSGANLYQINQFTIIENVTEKYYKTTSFMVNLSQLLFMITLILFIIPVVRIIEKTNLKTAGVICSGLTLVGAAMKVLAIEPNENHFRLVLVAQAICGFAQVFTIMLPAKVVAVWFPAEEQNRACAAALLGGELGMLLGAVFPILFVKDKNIDKEVKDGLFQMLLTNAVFCAFSLLVVILFFRPKPPLPPSIQQCAVGDSTTDFRKAFKELIANKDFIIVISLYGVACGMWSVFGIIENMLYLNYFPDSLIDLTSITTITTISGGMIGNVVFGYILDKTLKYKLFTSLNFLCITLSYGAMAVCFEMRWHWASYITMILFGFFSSCSVNISFQYIAEVTFPVSEVVTIAILQVALCIVTIVYEVLFNVLMDDRYYLIVHFITFGTFCVMTASTYFLTSNLKRMLVKQERQE